MACAELISEVIRDDAGLPNDQARLLAVGLVGMAQVAARYWLADDGAIPRDAASRLLASLSLAGHRRVPPDAATSGLTTERRLSAADAAPAAPTSPEVPVEVRIGVQHATRELVIDSTETTEAILATVSAAVSGEVSVLALTDERGRQVVVPSDKLAYVEIGEPESRRVGFGSL